MKNCISVKIIDNVKKMTKVGYFLKWNRRDQGNMFFGYLGDVFWQGLTVHIPIRFDRMVKMENRWGR